MSKNFDKLENIIYSFVMQALSSRKLNGILVSRGLSLSQLARDSGISRQSLYNMLKGASIYNAPFCKLLEYLKIGPLEITEEYDPLKKILSETPLKIQKLVIKLKGFCQKHHASLFLFGSQAENRFKSGSDWDFGVYFHRTDADRKLRLLKQDWEERTFPYRIDILNLNRAPEWFLESIRSNALLLEGPWPKHWKQVA